MIEQYIITPKMVRQFLKKVKEQIIISNELGKDHLDENNTFEPKL